MLSMNQVSKIASIYTADVSGVCSALYELGGLIVMHDASGCNSTYNTHDEPRWYHQDSMVYISGLCEIDAVLGADRKLIEDIVHTAEQLHPRFIAIAGTPIPMITGTDFEGIASVIEARTGIPTLGIPTNGMHSYIYGISQAFLAFANRFCEKEAASPASDSLQPKINLLGVTPLDFSVTGSAEALRAVFENAGISVLSSWAMNSSFETLCRAGDADVNVVVSAAGLEVADYFQRTFHTPYVVGLPIGPSMTARVLDAVRSAAHSGISQNLCSRTAGRTNPASPSACILGEPVFAASLRTALMEDAGFEAVTAINTLDFDCKDSSLADQSAMEEEDIEQRIQNAPVLLADPLFRPLIGKGKDTAFIALPHEAYSGRIYRKQIPVLIGNAFHAWIQTIK